MEQNFQNHARMVPLYHYVLSLIIVLLSLASIWNLYEVVQKSGPVLPALIFMLISAALVLTYVFTRTFPLKAQDRAIRSEENLRHYTLTQTLLPTELGVYQIVALRFASDEELPDLAKRAAAENMHPKSIKQAIRNWRIDNHRV